MRYKNASSIPLGEVYIHLWPNAYSSNKTAFAKQQLEAKAIDFHAAKVSNRGSIDSLNFQIENNSITVQRLDEYPDFVRLLLEKPILPQEEIVLSTPFRIKIPYSFSRLGHVEQSYQLTQWYPKPAVFDNRGWHPMPYLDQGEFYSEFGSFDVKITVPKNYIVAATGILQNAEEVAALKLLADSTAKIKSFDEDDMEIPPSDSETKVLHFKQNNVHDFAWFADKRFHVLQSEVQLPNSKRKVQTAVYFTNAYAKYWKNAAAFVDSSVYYYSLWNGDYPYDYCSAVDAALSAGAGMEYPMITVIGAVADDKSLDQVIAHEVGHNWFYGILGSNEREHGWMDEGVNSFYESRYMRMRYDEGTMVNPKNGLFRLLGLHHFPYHYTDYLLYQFTASSYDLQPIETPSEQFRTLNYATTMYTKTSIMLRHLELYLGTSVFDSCMQAYFNKWKFKHPYPNDMQAVFEEVSGQNLDWFFQDVILSAEQIDFEIQEVKRTSNQIRATIKNNSNIQMPVFVSTVDKNGKVLETFKTSPYIGRVQLYFDKRAVEKVVIDPYYIIPEYNRNNNTMRKSGLLKKVEPLRLQMFGGITRPDRTNLFVAPIAGYNYIDGFMPGLALYSNVFPYRNFEWIVAPMYGFQSNQLNGSAQVSLRLHPKFAEEILFQYSFSSYGFSRYAIVSYESGQANSTTETNRFLRNDFQIMLKLNENYSRSTVKRYLGYRLIRTENNADQSAATPLFIPNIQYNFERLLYHQFIARKNDDRILHPYRMELMLEFGQSNPPALATDIKPYQKLAFQYIQQVNYPGKKRGLNVRLFSGLIFGADSHNGSVNYFNLSGNVNYTFDKNFIQRYDFNSTQFHAVDGAFKSNTYTPNFRTLVALNLKAPMPFRIPVGVFADIAYAEVDLLQGKGNDYYDVGFYLSIVPNRVEVFFPLYTSNYNNYFGSNKPKFAEQIRFMVDLPSLNPLNFARNLKDYL
jgi:hypothetical protein